MALTDTEKAACRLYLGWSARFHQHDSRLEMALIAVGDLPEHQAQITNLITGSPPGLLACLQDIDSKLRGAHGRLKASEVGSIKLNAAELQQLRSEGRRFVGRLAAILGVEKQADVFASGGGAGGNYVGK